MKYNLLTISVTNRCNFACEYCPMKEFRNGAHNGKPQDVDIDKLIDFLGRCADPAKWYIEITGGEPSLHPNLFKLLDWLVDRNYKGHIKTNGQYPIPQTVHFPRIAAFHNMDKPPKYWDWYLIMHRDLEKQAKIDWCNEHSIQHRMDNCTVFKDMPIEFYANVCPSDEGGVVFPCYSHQDMKFTLPVARFIPCLPLNACYCANVAGFVWWQPELLSLCKI